MDRLEIPSGRWRNLRLGGWPALGWRFQRLAEATDPTFQLQAPSHQLLPRRTILVGLPVLPGTGSGIRQPTRKLGHA